MQPDVVTSSGIEVDADEDEDEDQYFADVHYEEYLTYSESGEVSGAQESGGRQLCCPGL